MDPDTQDGPDTATVTPLDQVLWSVLTGEAALIPFARAWLALLCRMLPGVERAVLVLPRTAASPRPHTGRTAIPGRRNSPKPPNSPSPNVAAWSAARAPAAPATSPSRCCSTARTKASSRSNSPPPARPPCARPCATCNGAPPGSSCTIAATRRPLTPPACARATPHWRSPPPRSRPTASTPPPAPPPPRWPSD